MAKAIKKSKRIVAQNLKSSFVIDASEDGLKELAKSFTRSKF